MAEEATIWFIWSLDGCYLYTLWQPKLCEVIRESSVPWQVEAYRDQVSLYQGYGAKGSNEALVCCDGRSYSRCVDEAIGQSEVWVLQGEAWCSLDRGPFQGEVTSPEAILTSSSNVRLSHSIMVRGLVPSMSDMSAEIHSHSNEQFRCKGWAILSWIKD